MSLTTSDQNRFKAVDFDPFADGEVLLTAPATESQKEIWASVRMGDDANCAYNESQTLRLKGTLEVELLQTALQSLVNRHESLRITISPDGTNLCINAELTLDIPFADLTSLNEQERQTQLNALIQTEVSQPFDLEHGPLFRSKIVRLRPDEHWVLLTAHHIICDGWSWGVLIPDLGKIYSALVNGETPALEPADQFSDYALAQAENVEHEETIATETFWLEQFSKSIPVLDFPTDYPRPPLRTFDADREDYLLSSDLVSSLKKFGTQSGCSFMTVILTGFEIFLHRLTGQPDLVVGVPAAGQVASGRYELVGHCVNLLPLRTQIDPQQSWMSYLEQRKSSILDAYDHQEFTFGSLVKQLALPRDPSRIPLVSVIFNIDQTLEERKLNFDGLSVEFYANPRAYENFELFINAIERQGQIILECQYNTNLFDAPTIRYRLAEFETLLTSLLANPESPIATLQLLPDNEQQLLASWNSTEAAYPQACLHQLVEQQASQTPDAIAVIYETQQLSYRELDERANQLAHYLQALGVGPEVLVGLCTDRSPDMVIGVLAILKAGGAYLPLDPDYPQDRVAFMLQDASVPILLTQEKFKAQLPAAEAQIVCIDGDWSSLLPTPGSAPGQLHPPITEVQPDHLAYVIYTSGSTGKPKGVQIEHHSAVNLLHAVRQQPGLTAQDVLLSVTTLSFDIALSEILLPLTVGAKVLLVSREVATDGVQLLQVMATGVTFMQPTPATWRLLLAAGWQGNPHLKMISTGEALSRDLANQLLPKGAELWNLYGPTETTVWATACRVEADETPILIGRPLPNLQVYILDAYLQPVPIGTPGELHIGGVGVARGYLNRPDLTEEKFIPDPFSSVPGARLYKTGDLARFWPNGAIECLGRIDHQVKVRGFRIELAEVEYAVCEHPSVKQCVVVAWKDDLSDERLVAYVVESREDRGATVAELRNFLKQKIPDFMMPSNFMLMDALPLTPNGKIDRKALLKPNATLNLAENYVPPRTPLEQEMAAAWAQVLKLERVGIHHNFFELGGHSLLSAQLLSRIRQTFGVNLPLRTLFEAATVAELTERLETILWVTEAATAHTPESYEEGEL